jgi:hypothetical protein
MLYILGLVDQFLNVLIHHLGELAVNNNFERLFFSD